ncbi:hypothetical protein VOLCADRAFT_58608, partial [Volvox carteri f. nagariensis]
RTFFSPAHRRAAEQIKAWMQDCGMESWIDVVGNVHGRIKASRDGTQAVLLGSHYDTVLDGGAYDGALGIIVGLAAVKSMLLTEMEGVRFQSTFLGSRAVEGGVADPQAAVAALALDPASISEYIEVHIEQGPVLEARGLPLGVVAGIAGQTRLWVHVNGTQGHAGTVPMRGRRDALAAAAELIVAVEELCIAPESEENLVCTVGEVQVWPGASNVISGHTGFSVDIRSKTDQMRNLAVARLLQAVETTCKRRDVACKVNRKHDAAAVLSDPEGLESVPVLVSGAGHDAMAIAEAIPKMGMMFVRCRGGVSHSPLEHVEPEDVTASTAALAAYLWGRVAGPMLTGPEVQESAAAADTEASNVRDEL